MPGLATPPFDPVDAVLTNADLVHEILVRVHAAAWPAGARATAAVISPAFAAAAARLAVTLDAADPTTWALARHGDIKAITAALAGLVAVEGAAGAAGAGERAGTAALARLLSSAGPLPALASLTAARAGPWLRGVLTGRTLDTLSLHGCWHRATAALPAGVGVSSALTLTQLPGGCAAPLPHPHLLRGVAFAPRITLVGLAGAVLTDAPPDLRELRLEGVPVVLTAASGGEAGEWNGAAAGGGGGGGGGAPRLPAAATFRFALPPAHPRLDRLSVVFHAPEPTRRSAAAAAAAAAPPPPPARPVAVEVAALGAATAALTLSAPGRTLRLVVPRPPPTWLAGSEEDEDDDDASRAAAALGAALSSAGLASFTVGGGAAGGGGWEVAVEGAAAVPGAAVVASGAVGNRGVLTLEGWRVRAQRFL